MLTYMNLVAIKEYLRKLWYGRTDRQTKVVNTFQLCWKVLKKGERSK